MATTQLQHKKQVTQTVSSDRKSKGISLPAMSVLQHKKEESSLEFPVQKHAFPFNAKPANNGVTQLNAVFSSNAEKDIFLEKLKTSVATMADDVLERVEQSASDCPYIAYWFTKYAAADASEVWSAIVKYVPQAAQAATQEEVIQLLLGRVRSGLEKNIESGSLAGVPDEVPKDLEEQKKVKEEAKPTPAVAQLCGSNVINNTQDRLNAFKDSTKGNFTSSRSAALERIGTRITTLAGTLDVGEPGGHDQVREIMDLIVQAENQFEVEARGRGESETLRYQRFTRWKYDVITNLPDADIRRVVSDFVGGTRMADRDHQREPLHIGADEEETGMGALKANTYGTINAGLRHQDGPQKGALYEAYRAMKHYESDQGNYLMRDSGRYHSPGWQDRYGNSLMGGVSPEAAVVDEVYTDQGFSFFGGNAGRQYGRYRMSVNLNKVMTIQSNMYGTAEREREYISAPGSRFAYRGVNHEIYNFEQV
jgi:3-deoxy-D-manno-octulosonate 8-phosphate phosphatase KdsC-like HAD superfamily phosphatase